MNDSDVNYTFYDKPKFLSPNPGSKIDNLGGIDEPAIETIEPGDKLLSSVASRLFPKKNSFRSVFESRKSKSLKRRSPKRAKSPRRSPKRAKSPRRSPNRTKSNRRSRKRRFGLRVMSGMGGLAYS